VIRRTQASAGSSKLSLGVEDDRQEIRIVRPKIAAWKLRAWEEKLFASAAEIPNWKLADKARRLLMDLDYRLSQLIPEPQADRPAEIPPQVAKQVAISSLSGITIRSCGSAMSLVACGYVLEAGGPARRGLEAKLRARAVLDDDSGQHARDWLTRPMQGWKKLAERYGSARDLEFLSVFAHADARGLIPLHAGPPGGYGEGEVRETNIDLRPSRREPDASRMLSALAYEFAVYLRPHRNVKEACFGTAGGPASPGSWTPTEVVAKPSSSLIRDEFESSRFALPGGVFPSQCQES
jgi:hypothetical protein